MRRRRYLDVAAHRDRIAKLREELGWVSDGSAECYLPRIVRSASPASQRQVRAGVATRELFARAGVVEHAERTGASFLEHIAQIGWPPAVPDRYRVVDSDGTSTPRAWCADSRAWSNLRAHLRLLEDALATDADSVLVLDDRARLSATVAAELDTFLGSLPADWCMLTLARNEPLAYVVRGRAALIWYGALASELASTSATAGIDSCFARMRSSGDFAIHTPERDLAFTRNPDS